MQKTDVLIVHEAVFRTTPAWWKLLLGQVVSPDTKSPCAAKHDSCGWQDAGHPVRDAHRGIHQITEYVVVNVTIVSSLALQARRY